MALSGTNTAILGRSECVGLKVERYANSQVGNGLISAKPLKMKRLHTQTNNVKIRSQQMETVNLQPCLVRREALLGIGMSFLTIFSPLAESAEARTVKPDVRKKIQEKLDELREKAGLKKKSKDDGEKTPKAPSDKVQKEETEGLLVETDFSG